MALCFFRFLIIAPTVVNFSPSCLLFFVAHPSLVQVYNFVPDVLRQLLCIAHGENVGMWLCGQVPFLQLHNDVTS